MYFRLHYFSVRQSWSWKRLYLNTFLCAELYKSSDKIFKVSEWVARNNKRKKKWVPSWSTEHWLYRKGLI